MCVQQPIIISFCVRLFTNFLVGANPVLVAWHLSLIHPSYYTYILFDSFCTGLHYRLLNTSVIFTPNDGLTQSIYISLIEDPSSPANREFTISLVSNDSRVYLATPAIQIIQILNEDGKFLYKSRGVVCLYFIANPRETRSCF